METVKDYWRKIPDFNPEYWVSCIGDIYSEYSRRILQGTITKRGYRHMKIRGAMYMAHRMVGWAWVSNPDKKPFINHIDGNKLNNHPSNLEWVTCKENLQHAWATGLMNHAGGRGKPVSQLDLDGNHIRDFESIAEVSRLDGFDNSSISAAANGVTKTSAGYRWMFKDKI